MGLPRACARCLVWSVFLPFVACESGPEPGQLTGWNVLLVTIDTLRADRVGYAGYEPASTPSLDALAEEGIVFEGAVASGPVTLPSHATILTGLYPPTHGALDNGYYSIASDVPALPDVLRGAGYEAAAIVGAIVLQGRYGLDTRFDHYDDEIHNARAQGQAYRERRADEVSELASRWLRERDDQRPFFLWVHYYDPHAPYDPPTGFDTRFASQPYDGEIAYTDESLGRLLETLDELGERERTLVVVTSDHGEAFGDGGELTHGILLRESTLRVPLLFAAPGELARGKRVDGAVSIADIAPTVLELLGVAAKGRVDGVSLVEAMRDGRASERYVYSETRLPFDSYGWSMLAGVRDESWAWVRAPRPELYDLANDPDEERSEHEARPGLAAELDGHVERILSGTRDERMGELSREEIEAFRSLGYLFSKEAPEPTGADPKDMLGLLVESNWIANLLDRGETAQVIERSKRLLEKDPGNRDALLYLGQALDREGRTEEAVEAVREAFERGGSLDLEGTLLAMFLMKVGRIEESESLLRAFTQAEPDFAEHAFNLGNLLSHDERLDEAVEAYDQALRVNPEGVHILSNLALSLSQLPAGERDPRRALELIDRAISLAVEDDIPSLVKISICRNLGQRELALDVARELQNRRKLHRVSSSELADAIRSLQES